jgi:hypothetical protein
MGKIRTTPRGAMTLISAFLFFAFSTIGLAMLYLSQIYLKLGMYKKNTLILEYASENGIKDAHYQLTQLIRQAPVPIILSAEKNAEFYTDAMGKGTKAAEELLGQTLPLTCGGAWENLSWSAITDFSVKRIEESADYFLELFDILVHSEGSITNFKQKHASSLLAELEVWVGHVPLPTIPILIDKPLSPHQQETFTQDNSIEILASSAGVLPPGASFSPGELVPTDPTSLVAKALKIKIFQPQELSQALLRVALGLEPSDDPVPDGVYLIHDDLGLGGIFVEGDLDEMILAIENSSQIISFRSEYGQWQLRFNPSGCETEFLSPEGTQYFNLIPRGIIVVNGAIHSLGGGIIDSSGEAAMIRDEEIPCILKGVNLTIISSEKTTLSSHLIHQGAKWEDGIPYVKDSHSQLHIFAAGQDVQGNSTESGEIVIASDSPDELKVQASLTASGKGISVEGTNKTVNLLGSLQTKEYNSNGNTLKLTPDQRFFADATRLENAPKSAKPILHIASFRAMEWKEGV